MTPNSITGSSTAPAVVVSVSPVVLPAPGRPVDLQVRVTAPATGHDLPLLLMSHGQGPSNNLSSLHGYLPLVQHFAARGFVVVQPTHLSSATLKGHPGLRDHPEAPLFWRERALDMTRILDALAKLEAAVPQIAGRIDHGKVAVVGHSMGGHTASLLLGARFNHPSTGETVDVRDLRIITGALLAAPGRGGEALSATAARHYPFLLTTDFSTMTAPALVVAGDNDPSPHLTVLGSPWHTDPYRLAPAPKTLLTVYGAEHMLGGISGFDAAETSDENPARVEAVARLTGGYLRTQLIPGDPAWREAQDALLSSAEPAGQVVTK
ncbi:alpha/beta hydrolase family protein [Micromonospora endolithica]|uniref:Chlorophyllase n=1 Tax=Micromonospora endolithica TaxID=230091 RepID=A0A3A9ZGY0_9ACTN|nr:CocE/NonD family hydrolase [Micromonospora endolithica]RKN47583.1 chlorophyllase [Micromonospora endolithica]TWJ21231.1 X-Pro dipeptidyl-peptidase-like protein [Micromonospora endolithica]